MSRSVRIDRPLLLLATAVAALVAAVPATGADAPASRVVPQLRETPSSQYPNQAYVLSLPRRAELTASSLVVLENGEPVQDLELALPGTTGATFGVVLLIDASNSMEGKPITGAMAAARAFASELPDGVQLSVVLFNNATTTLLPLSDDPLSITEALAKTPPLAFGTRIYDAVDAAEQQLSGAGITVGSIIVLSDGNDVGSLAAPDDALARASAAKVRIFAVGLQSAQFDPTSLQGLAKATGGSFALASSIDDLEAIYKEIGETISSDYLMTYTSLADTGQAVAVAVKVAGFPGIATANYQAPGLPRLTIGDKGILDRILQSGILAVLVCVLIAALVGFGTYLLVQRRDRRVERRLSHFVTISDEEERARLRREDVSRELSDHDASADEPHRSIRHPQWYERLERDIEIGRGEMSASHIVALTALATVAAAAIGAWTLGPLGLLAALIPGFVAHWIVGWRVRRIRQQFADELPETLDVVASALRAGHSLVGALNVAVEGAPEPSRTELGRAMADEQLGVPLDDALRVVAHRMDSRDMMQVALVAQLQREAGTNAAEVLDQVSNNIRNAMDLRRLVKTLTAQGRMSRWIVSILPLFLFVALYFLNKDYLRPLWETTGGTVAMVAAVVMIVSGSLIIKKIVEIDV